MPFSNPQWTFERIQFLSGVGLVSVLGGLLYRNEWFSISGILIDYADKAVVRLQKKYHRMILRGVKRNIAITAVARELACFVWGIETGHIS